MKKIFVKSLPLKDVLDNLSEAMNTVTHQDCDMYELTIPKAWGQGYVKGINFPGGIGLINYDCHFNEDVQINFTVGKIHPAKFIYLLLGKLKHQFENETEIHNLNQHQSAIVASNDHHGHILRFEGGQRIKMCSVEIDRKQFSLDMRCEIDQIDNPLKELFYDVNASTTFYYEGNYSLSLFDKLREADRTHCTGFERKLFLFGTSLGVIYEQLISYQEEIDLKPADIKVKQLEIKIAQKAVNFIYENMSKPVNIQTLAQEVGTNSTKLQEAFKMMYGLTVNNFIKKARIEKAADMLVNTDKNVTLIVSEVGLINRGYFSKIFKSHYDSTPQAYRKKYSNRLLTLNLNGKAD